MLKSIEFWNFVLSALTFIVGLVIGFVSWKWVRPADRRLKIMEAALTRNNEAIGTIRSAMIEAGVRNNESRHTRVLESCLQVYKVFRKINSSCGIMAICRCFRDLEEIRIKCDDKRAIAKFAEWVLQFIPKDVWTQEEVREVAEAELFVPARVWQIYGAASMLIGCFQAQLLSLASQMDGSLVNIDQIYQKVDAILPGQLAYLKQFGSRWYGHVLEALQRELVAEIRKVVGMEPVAAENVVALNEGFEEKWHQKHPVPDEFKEFMS